MKKSKVVWIIIAVSLLVILSFYFFLDKTNEREDYSLILGEFEDFAIMGSSIYQTDWKGIIDETASEEEIGNSYGVLFLYLTSIVSNQRTINEDCINNKESYVCLFIYSVINNKKNLCNNFPEARTVEECGRHGCFNSTYPYQDACVAQVKLYERYSKSENHVSFCKSLDNDFAQLKCLTYTAIIQKDQAVCSNLDSEIYSCYYEVLCGSFPHVSEEMYQCRLEVCDLSKSSLNLAGCKIGANDSNPEIYN